MTIQTSDNKFAVAQWIVDPIAGLGTHTTIASAIASASSGETIFIKPGTYTENLTLSDGVNLAAFNCDALTPNVTIVGKCSFSAAGTVSLSGIRFQTNSDFAIEVSGSNASIMYLKNCFLEGSDNSLLTMTSSSSSSRMYVLDSYLILSTTGVAFFVGNSAGNLLFLNCLAENFANSTTASTWASSGTLVIENCPSFPTAITTSDTSRIAIIHSRINANLLNTTALTVNGTGASTAALYSRFDGGSAPAISIGAGATFTADFIDVSSTNTNAITGAGTLAHGNIVFTGSSSTINTTTQTRLNVALGASPTLTFTPVLNFGGATTGITYGTQSGVYRIQGNILFYNIILVLTSKGTATGSATITGLPVNSAASPQNTFVPLCYSLLTFTANYVEGRANIAANSSILNLQQQGSGQASAAITDTNFADTTTIQITGYYFI